MILVISDLFGNCVDYDVSCVSIFVNLISDFVKMMTGESHKTVDACKWPGAIRAGMLRNMRYIVTPCHIWQSWHVTSHITAQVNNIIINQQLFAISDQVLIYFVHNCIESQLKHFNPVLSFVCESLPLQLCRNVGGCSACVGRVVT